MSDNCYKWGSIPATAFNTAEWVWNKCPQVDDCPIWSTTPYLWKDADWWWSQCGAAPVEECPIWSTTPYLWKDADWWWSICGPQPPPDLCEIWSTTQYLWKDADWWWSSCGPVVPPTSSVVPIVQPPGVDATTLIQPWLIEPWNPYRTGSLAKRKKLIKLICKVNGQVFEQEKESEKRTMTIDDISMEIGSFNNIGLDIRVED